MSEEDEKALEVIYNSICPICDAGICRFQKKVNPDHGHYLWLDINSAPDRLAKYGIGVDDVRLKLHAIDRKGNLRVGMEAVTAIFAETPNYRWLAVLAELPLLKQIAARIYNVTAFFLYKWNTSKGRW
jgi:predicted DCC family thiol-disulfide oxidoreductase YuxK